MFQILSKKAKYISRSKATGNLAKPNINFEAEKDIWLVPSKFSYFNSIIIEIYYFLYIDVKGGGGEAVVFLTCLFVGRGRGSCRERV